MTTSRVELSAAKRELLRRRLQRREPSGQRIPRRADDSGPPPLSYAQQRFWFMEQFAPGTGAFTVPLCLRLTGPVDVAALRAALTEVTRRHQCLRSRFTTADDGVARIETAEPVEVDLPVWDVSGEDDRGQRANDLIAAEIARPFDLCAGPLLRAALVRVDDADHILLVATHHVVSDGWSTEVLADEVLGLYAAEVAAGPGLAEPPVQYGDYAAWHLEQHSAGALDAAREYWQRQLAGVPPLDLPLDGARGAEPTYAGASHRFRLPKPLLAQLRDLAATAGTTLYLTVLAAYELLLHRHSGQHDFAVGSPVSGRPAPELERLIGLFVNMLPMRADVSGDPTFAELLARTNTTALDAWSHQNLPFEQLVQDLEVDREPSRSPVFQTVFVLNDYLQRPAADGPRRAGELTAERFPFDLHATRYDLELYAFESPDGLECAFVFNTDLFARDRVERMAGHLRTLLESAVARPDAPVSELTMLTPAELADIRRWNDTAVDLGEPSCLHRLFLEQARRTPDAVAIVDARSQTTYGALETRVRALAAQLSGCERGELVAVVMERGVEQAVAALAIQLAGAAYLPVEADLPAERRDELLRLGHCRTAVTQPWLAERLSWPDDVNVRVVSDRVPDEVPEVVDDARPDDLAYVIFTSGSTGEPKGVMIDHQAAVNTVRDINQRFGITSADRVFAVSQLSFDLSVQDIFGTLAVGGTLLVPEPAGAKDPAVWARWVERERATVWTSAPALLELLIDHAETEGTAVSTLRVVMLSGDWIPLDLPQRLWALAGDAKFYSQGGATEASIWSCYYPVERVDPEWRSIPYGRPLGNQTMYVLDANGGHVPVGVTGELYIGGDGVSIGYWDDPERSAERFIEHAGTGERLYRTGDLCRYGRDGLLEILGRVDFQVKIRGYRIEPGEIEAHLARCPGVAECVVMVRRPDGVPTLVAYVVPADGAEPSGSDLRSELVKRLPGYMVPSHYVSLLRLPLNVNGKVDRSLLPDPGQTPRAGREHQQPQTATERAVAAVFAEVIGLDAIGLDEDFFDAGGHSLAAIQAVTRLRRQHAAAFGVATLFRHPTVRELAALLDRPESDAERTLLYRLTPDGRDARMSFICVPYGGGQPMAYQALADALPADCALYAVGIPGHDPSLPEEEPDSVEAVAAALAEEIARTPGLADGRLVIYGHCGIGGSTAVQLAGELEAAGRALDAVLVGGIFPYARPQGRVVGPLARLTRFDRLGGDRAYHNRLRSMGADLDGLEPAQVRFMVRNLRRDEQASEDYFTRLLADPPRLRAPVVSVVGDRDPLTKYYEERYREWHVASDTTGVVVLDEAGHYFLRHRADELARILTTVPAAVTAGEPGELSEQQRGPRASWWLREVSVTEPADRGAGARAVAVTAGPPPSLRRFLLVALSQLVSFTGTALTDFALPAWVYLQTGSLGDFALMIMLAIMPGVFAAPLVGAWIDRASRRVMMIVGVCAAGAVQLVLGLLVWTGSFEIWHAFPLIALLSVALSVHRLAYMSAIPQLAPKAYLGHANGVVQLANGIAQFIAPLAAVALLSWIGLGGILVLDLVTFVVAVSVLLVVTFPRTMAYTPREPLRTEISAGVRLLLGNRSFRAALIYFALLNVLLAPVLMALLPLSLSFGDLSTAATVSVIGGVGATVGGLAVAFWGGPARRRMRGMLIVSLLFGVFAVIAGLHASVAVVGLGAFGVWGALSVANGVYLTIIHVKLPHRYHGRAIALNQAMAWSTLPLGFVVVAPLGESLVGLQPMYIALGIALFVFVLVAMRVPRLARFDDEVPDAEPDDLIGARTVAERAAGQGGEQQ